MMSIEEKSSPIEVWLSKATIGVTCRIVYTDESTDDREVDSTSLRGAAREVTGWLIARGYRPVGRWADGDENDSDDGDTWRVFRLAETEGGRVDALTVERASSVPGVA